MILGVLSACTSASPEDTVNDFLNTIKTSEKGLFDESLANYWVSDSSEMSEVSDIENYNDASAQMYLSYIKDFDYTILDSSIDGDSAVVSIEFTTYPIAEMSMAWMMEMFNNLFDPDIAALSEEELEIKSVEWFEEVASNYSKDRVNIVSVNLEKVDGEWLFSGDEDNFEFINALFGGMLSGFDGDEQ